MAWFVNADGPCRHRAALGAERLLWSIALGCASFYTAVQWQAHTARHAVLAAAQSAVAPAAESRPSAPVVIGRLRIPALALTVPVLSDYDPASLLRGVGHIQGTALPGGLGNMALAGHRDTYFRPLRRIAHGMILEVTDTDGLYRYAVDTTEIVTPEQVSVLDIRSRPELTLITCYPFDYIGAAPRRFIVHAHLLSVSAENVAHR